MPHSHDERIIGTQRAAPKPTPVEPAALQRAKATLSQPPTETATEISQTPLTAVTVQLSGTDGNAFAILATVRRALVRAGHRDLVTRFVEEATAGSYDDLLTTCCIYVHVR